MRILIAEDEDTLARDLEITLQDAGFCTHRVTSGKYVVPLLEKESFDLLLLDIVMPSTNGFEVLMALKECAQVPPVIVMTNLGHEEDQRAAKALGAEEYFVKAEHVINIVNHIRRIMEDQQHAL